nr:uracil-DNA glycosylase [Stenoxybacter acetivorans]
MWLKQGAHLEADDAQDIQAAAEEKTAEKAASAASSAISHVRSKSQTAKPRPADIQALLHNENPKIADNTTRLPASPTVFQTADTRGIDTPESLAAALSVCQSCALCHERRQALSGSGQLPARLLVLCENPSPQDDMNGALFSGEVDILLTNMLRAVGLRRDDAYVTAQVKCAPNISLYASKQQKTACRVYLKKEWEWSQAKAVLLLGETFQQMPPKLIARLCGSIPYAIVPHPARLLTNGGKKAAAWQTLRRFAASM